MVAKLIYGEINIDPLIRAAATFDEFNAGVVTKRDKTAVIKAFEYCYELSWKTLKKILDYKGIEAIGSRDVFREAAKVGLIDDPEIWFGFIEDRNLSSHTYNEDTANELYQGMSGFQAELHKLLNKLNGLDV